MIHFGKKEEYNYAMSTIISFFAESWTVVLPILLAISGFLFGSFQKKKASKEKGKRHVAEFKATSEELRAVVAESTRDYLIDKSGKTDLEIADEIARSRTNRDHFSK